MAFLATSQTSCAVPQAGHCRSAAKITQVNPSLPSIELAVSTVEISPWSSVTAGLRLGTVGSDEVDRAPPPPGGGRHGIRIDPHRLDRLAEAAIQQRLTGRPCEGNVLAPHDLYKPLNRFLVMAAGLVARSRDRI